MKKILAFLAALTLIPIPKAAAYSATLETVSASTDEAFEKRQIKQITLDGFSSLMSVTVTDGAGNVLAPTDYSCEFSGNILSITLDNGASHREKSNPKKHLKNVQTTEKNANSGAFPEELNYTSSDGYSGTLNKLNDIYVDSGTYTPRASKTVTQTKQNTSNSFASSIAYNDGTYSGTLTKSGEAVYRTDLKEGKSVSVSLGRMFIVGRDVNKIGYMKNSSGSYQSHKIRINTSLSRGFGGFFSSNIGSYSYCRLCENAGFGSGASSLWGGVINSYGLKIDSAMSSIPSTYSYSSGGYSGTLTLSEVPKSCWGEVAYYILENAFYSDDSSSAHPKIYYDNISPHPDITLSSFMSGSSVSYTAQTLSAINSQISSKSSTLSSRAEVNSYSVSNYALLFESPLTYTGEAYKTTEPAYEQTYSGVVVRPESDTRIYAQAYQGTVYKAGNAPVYSYNIEVQYIAADFSEPPATALSITNKTEIQSRIYGKSDDMKIVLNVTPSTAERWFTAEASCNGKQFSAVWSNGSAKIRSDSEFQGEIEINPAYFQASAKNALVTVTLTEFADENLTEDISQNTETVRINIDITPPVVSHFVNRRLGTVTLTAADALSGVESLQYRVNGGDWSDYTAAVTVSENCAIEAKAVDKCGNQKTEIFSIKLEETLDETDVNVYVTKSRGHVCYIINSNQSNSDELPLSELSIE